nr:MAG TPA: hypothetical protein [Caudoviricetes sp.]
MNRYSYVHVIICLFSHMFMCSYVNCWKIPYFGAIYSY